LALAVAINEQLDLGFRFASGSNDPVSTNQTLDDSMDTKALWLDRAYFDWHPTKIAGLNVYGGKMPNPFYNVGKAELIWDGDLNPEGIAAKYVIPFGERDALHLAGGGFWVDESSASVDTFLWGAQGYWKHTFPDERYLLGGVSYFDFGNIQDRGNLNVTWSGRNNFLGNSTRNNQYISDFDIVEGFAEYGFKVRGMPVAVFGDYAYNMGASTSDDTGWLIGMKLNKAKAPRSWEFTYDYRDLQADAVLGSFTNSDFIGGGTDGRGHHFGFKYQLTKNLQTALTYYHADSGYDDEYRRLMLDLIFKF
jgi:hypothetical protein